MNNIWRDKWLPMELNHAVIFFGSVPLLKPFRFKLIFGTLSNFLYILSLWISWMLPFISYILLNLKSCVWHFGWSGIVVTNSFFKANLLVLLVRGLELWCMHWNLLRSIRLALLYPKHLLVNGLLLLQICHSNWIFLYLNLILCPLLVWVSSSGIQTEKLWWHRVSKPGRNFTLFGQQLLLCKRLVFCPNNGFSNVIVECNFAKLVDFLNSDRIFYLEVVVWILEDIKLICEQVVSKSFVSVPLRCNRFALALASAIKKNEEVIIWLEECPSFFFPIVKHDIKWIKSTIISYKNK